MTEPILPTVAIIEPHREFAAPLQEIVTLARCRPVTMAEFDELSRLPVPPIAIVVRVDGNPAHTIDRDMLLRHLAMPRPKLLALASTDADVVVAERLGCDLVLREPQQVRALYDALMDFTAPH